MAASPSIGEKIRKEPEKYKGFFKGWPSTGSELGMYVEPLKYFPGQGCLEACDKSGGGSHGRYGLRCYFCTGC
jgi:branched-chain amino acid transport system substrate-binding protein